jgi:NAD(P)-dependent dehydrogenase (short-subunit alcohol dehydrogenase family)
MARPRRAHGPALIPMGRAGSAEEAAEAILWLLSDKVSYVTGANIRVAGGR